MSKKNRGATFGVLVAVSIGATAYASTMSNLDKDTNTKDLSNQKVSYVQTDYASKVKEVKANYTEEVKNTKFAEGQKSNKVVLYQKKTTAVEEKTSEVKEETPVEETKVKEASAADEKVSENQLAQEDFKANNETSVEKEEETEETEKADDQAETENPQEVEEEYFVEEENKEEAPVENEVVEESPVTVEKYVAVEYLNVRTNPDTESDVVTTLKGGSKVTGIEKNGWVELENGYVDSNYLQNLYPESLVKAMEEKEEQERKAEEERKKQEEEARKAEEAKKAEEEKKRQEEEARKAEEERKRQEEEANKEVEYTGWVNTATLNVRNNPSTDSSIINVLTMGDKISGTLSNGWLKFNLNGSLAYVNADFLVDYEVEKPAPVEEVQEEEQAPEVEEEQYVEETEQVEEAPQVSGNGESAASIAQQFLGYPYVWGSADPSTGFDCSGLVYYAYSQLGVTLSRNSAAQFSNGYAVDASNLVPGDLVFFSYGGGSIDHVGMVTGYDGTFIHASTPGVGVVYGNVYSDHYQSVFAGARRIF